jgi:ADP-ribose pyrophosphatase YjhB (NUDIX family)
MRRFCFLPGGRVKDGEASSEAIARELHEEIKRPVFFGENFFSLHGERFHELCLYYEVNVPVFASLPSAADNADELLWVGVKDAVEVNLKPKFLAARLENLPHTLEHLVLYDS